MRQIFAPRQQLAAVFLTKAVVAVSCVAVHQQRRSPSTPMAVPPPSCTCTQSVQGTKGRHRRRAPPHDSDENKDMRRQGSI